MFFFSITTTMGSLVSTEVFAGRRWRSHLVPNVPRLPGRYAGPVACYQHSSATAVDDSRSVSPCFSLRVLLPSYCPLPVAWEGNRGEIPALVHIYFHENLALRRILRQLAQPRQHSQHGIRQQQQQQERAPGALACWADCRGWKQRGCCTRE